MLTTTQTVHNWNEEAQRYNIVIVLLVLAISGLFLNGTALWALLLRYQSRNNSLLSGMVLLQVSECLFCIAVILLQSVELALHHAKVRDLAHPLITTASILYYPASWTLLTRNIWMTAIALLRVYALVRPLQAYRWFNFKRQIALFCILSVLCLPLMIGTAVYYLATAQINSTISFNNILEAESRLLGILLIVRVFQCGLPVPLVLAASFVITALLLHQNICMCNKKIVNHSCAPIEMETVGASERFSQLSSSSATKGVEMNYRTRRVGLENSELHASRTTLTLAVVFGVLELPGFCFLIVSYVWSNGNENLAWTAELNWINDLFMLLDSNCNFLIFFSLSQRFRKIVSSLWISRIIRSILILLCRNEIKCAKQPNKPRLINRQRETPIRPKTGFTQM